MWITNFTLVNLAQVKKVNVVKTTHNNKNDISNTMSCGSD
jgi:hypothetical protein